MEDIEKNDDFDKKERDEIYSKAVRAGKRTYFFDVKATRKNDYYLTITESKKRFNPDGKHFFEKHKLFLYKEDFEKFADGLNDVVSFIKTQLPGILEKRVSDGSLPEKEFTDVEFDDLGSKEK
jgi:hypothetical protein